MKNNLEMINMNLNSRRRKFKKNSKAHHKISLPESVENEFIPDGNEFAFIDALATNFDKFIFDWIVANCYDHNVDGFRYLNKKQKSDAYIDFIIKNEIMIDGEDLTQYTYLKFIDRLDEFFLNDCYMLTDKPYRFYKFKY